MPPVRNRSRGGSNSNTNTNTHNTSHPNGHANGNSRSRRKFYAVTRGRVPGIYATWDETLLQVDRFRGTQYKSFSNRIEAQRWFDDEIQREHRPSLRQRSLDTGFQSVREGGIGGGQISPRLHDSQVEHEPERLNRLRAEHAAAAPPLPVQENNAEHVWGEMPPVQRGWLMDRQREGNVPAHLMYLADYIEHAQVQPRQLMPSALPQPEGVQQQQQQMQVQAQVQGGVGVRPLTIHINEELPSSPPPPYCEFDPAPVPDPMPYGGTPTRQNLLHPHLPPLPSLLLPSPPFPPTSAVVGSSSSASHSLFPPLPDRLPPSTQPQPSTNPDLSRFLYKNANADTEATALLPPEPKIPLTDEQKEVLDLVLSGKNVFFTGPAGTGKSLILEHVKYHLAKLEKRYAITAPTGIAAVLLGGTTIHSFSGVGWGEKGMMEYVGMSRSGRTQIGQKRNQWRDTKVLVIDEISMLNAGLWEKLNGIAKAIRENDSFFGGMQLVVCGDFFQLPPVGEREDQRMCAYCGKKLPGPRARQYLAEPPQRAPNSVGLDPKRWARCDNCGENWNDTLRYCFQTRTWAAAKFSSVLLNKIHRQSDQLWIKMLKKIKLGLVDNEVTAFLSCLQRPLSTTNGVKPTRLYTHRLSVDSENALEFSKLPGKEVCFNALDRGLLRSNTGGEIRMTDLSGEQYFRSLQSNILLRLKPAAQVMLLSNIDPAAKLVNGSRGVVTGFVHYSRKELKTLPLDADRAMLERFFDANEDKKTHKVALPLVAFAAIGSADPGKEAMGMPVLPVMWSQETRAGAGVTQRLERVQLPLALAWAATVHKAQGMTLDYAAVDIGNAFEPGQAYVGLSRCRCTKGLQILGGVGVEGLRRACRSCPIVGVFYKDLVLRIEARKRGVEEHAEEENKDNEEEELDDVEDEVKSEVESELSMSYEDLPEVSLTQIAGPVTVPSSLIDSGKSENEDEVQVSSELSTTRNSHNAGVMKSELKQPIVLDGDSDYYDEDLVRECEEEIARSSGLVRSTA